MHRHLPKLSPLSVESFVDSWVNELDKFGGELEPVIQKMTGEILSIFKVDKGSEGSRSVYDLSFIWAVLSRERKRSHSTSPLVDARSGLIQWVSQLKTMLGYHHEPDSISEVHECSHCGEVQRQFSWQCKSCKSWESLNVWSHG
jgi:hypothetical protein